MEEKILDYENMEWQEAMGYPPGTKIQVFREEEGAKTFLLKLSQGFRIEAHCHSSTTQYFVLMGQYEIDGKDYGPGSYNLIPEGDIIDSFASRNGAILLVIWDPSIKK